MDPIRILDVIAKPYASWSSQLQYFLVLDRLPEKIYEKDGNRFTSKDSGFYDFLQGCAGKGPAFAGREFSIRLTDGSDFLCQGQVWSVSPPEDFEPVVEVGVGTLDSLSKCYVFYGASVQKALLQAWLAKNIASNRYEKYDARQSLDWAWQYRHSPRIVCNQRARTLRKRGVLIETLSSGQKAWYPGYERQAKELKAKFEADMGSIILS